MVSHAPTPVNGTLVPTFPKDTLIFPVPQDGSSNSPLHLKSPNNIKTEIIYDPKTNTYSLVKKIGDLILEKRDLSFEEYQNYNTDRMIADYWRDRASAAGASLTTNAGLMENLIPQLKVKSELFETIFGGNTIDIRPMGSAEISFAVLNNRREDNSININQRSVTSFDFDEQIELNVHAQIGEAIGFNLNYNTQATFSFENELKLKYEGKEDNILQAIEAGNINFTLPTRLISGIQNIFGAKTKLKFGKLTVDALFGEQRSQTNNIQLQGGAQMSEVLKNIDDYEENRHYFLSQYFYEHYNEALATLPIINSNINIIKIEVWKTNVGSAIQENRNLVAFSDIGENRPYSRLLVGGGSTLPHQLQSNNLFFRAPRESLRNINTVSNYLQGIGFISGQDYEKVESARKLSPSEYSLNSRLGFISLTQPLNADQVLAVAFRYQIIGDTTIYQVGEFSDEGVNDPNTLVVKLLKSSTLNTGNPIWKLMMKNVYSLKDYQISREDFRLNILYSGDASGVPTGYFNDGPKKGIPLIQIFGFDRMDFQQNPSPDGVFDFIDNASTQGGTINAYGGRIYFPYVEPFGKDLRQILGDETAANKYCFDSLYTLTKVQAQQYTEKNKYRIEAMYKSSSGSEISLGGMNIPEGSVKVMAGGIVLTEGADYTVDYQMGRVKIINQGYLNSGTPITVSSENNSFFSPMTKRLIGSRANYEFSSNLNVGLSFLNLRESSVTSKINYGEEPISNSIWGTDLAYKTELPFLTKILDWLPFYQTKAKSHLTFSGEFAHFIPGYSSAIEQSGGTAYIDDFEGAARTYELKNAGFWHLASTPQDYNSTGALFRETAPASGLTYGYNRALLAWYTIDDIFYGNSRPSNITKDDISKPYTRQILQKEVFPNKDLEQGRPSSVREFNLAFYPSERGPYNFDIGSAFSAGILPNGNLKNPESRWAGIMRKMDITDFEGANVEYIEFWLMDPFLDNPNHQGGKFYINLGDISEDILRDGRKSFENGLPVSAAIVDVDTTIWGRVPRIQAIVNAFDNDPDARRFQDIGLDGLNSQDEVSFFQDFLNIMQTQLTPEAYASMRSDPSNDDFRYFRSTDFDSRDVKILERYKRFSMPENNSPTTEQSGENYPTQSTSMPNTEDINQDNTLSEAENYYQYEIDLTPDKMVIGENYITDIQHSSIEMPNGTDTTCRWYQFKVPVRNPDKTIGNIEGFQSIRFMRMFLRNFSEPVILRFATLELVCGEWRKYTKELLEQGAYPSGSQAENTVFTVATINIEENGARQPVPYVLPAGIERERFYSNTSYQDQNEQSLSLRIMNLADGDARAIYKTANLDIRQYKKLRMFVHAEKARENDPAVHGDLALFIRLGSDYTENYYEYEIPLQYTPWYTSSMHEDLIWPESNEAEVDLIRMVKTKENRNAALRSGNNTVISSTIPYSEYEGKAKYTVVGSPSISSLKVLMIGVRNPRKKQITDSDDMLPKSAEIWINELRLTDFDTRGGWAITGFARTNLADLGDLSMSGSFTSAGFGTLEQRIATLSQENAGTFDISTNLELGKFIPEKVGMRIPLHFDYSRSVRNPKYTPLDPDVRLTTDLQTYQTEREKDSIRQMVQAYTSSTNINFMNVRKDRTGEKALTPRFYQIENWNASFSYSKQYQRSVDIKHNLKQQYRGALGYAYSLRPKAIKPFGKVGFLQNKYFAILRDLTLYFQPKSLTFHTDMMRDYEETTLRAKSIGDIIMTPYYFKQFFWNRNYTIDYDLSSNLRMKYDASMRSLILEPQGKIDTKEKRDTVWQNIFDLGTAQQFNQNFNANYTIPINKLPFLDWLRASSAYHATYAFTSSTEATRNLGNTIENSQRITINANASLSTLYNKVGFIKKAYENKNKRPSFLRFAPNKDAAKTKLPTPEKGTKDSVESGWKEMWTKIRHGSLRFITGIKTISLSYNDNRGTYLPGFMPQAHFFGMDNKTQWAPGFGFVFGSQKDIVPQAIANNWLSKDSLMNAAVQKKRTQQFNGNVSIEPFKSFRIDLTFTRSYSENYTAYYKYNPETQLVEGPMSPLRTGNFSISTWSFFSLFESSKENNHSEVFQSFLSNRIPIAERLAAANRAYNSDYMGQLIQDTTTGAFFPDGYGRTSQQVLLPAFLAAYTGKDVKTISFNPFLNMPMPSWRISYNGLSEMEWIKKWANSITITNNYSSTYSVSAFTSDPVIPKDDNYTYGHEWIRNDINNNFIPAQLIDQVSINEQFSPLIKVDMNLKNSLQLNIELRTSRNLSLSFSNNQLTEMKRESYVVGLGYRFKDVEINIRSGSIARKFKSDIVLRADFTRNVNRTTLRKIDQNVNLLSSGMEVYTINFSGDYAISEKILVRAFFEMKINNPYISNTVPNSNTRGGVSIRVTL